MGNHDSGIALIKDGVPEYIIEEERLNREKKTLVFPALSLEAMFRETGLTFSDIDAITTPWDTGALRWTTRRQLLRRFPLSLAHVLPGSHPTFQTTLLYTKMMLRRNMKKLYPNQYIPKVIGVNHHTSHASCFFVSPFEEASVLIMDGHGDDCSTSLYHGAGNKLELRWKNKIEDSLGGVYTFISQFLGFGVFGDEGKVMGLSAYGEPTYVEKMRDLIILQDEGKYRINMSYFHYDIYGFLKPFKRKFFDVFGAPANSPDEMTQRHMDIAYALQVVTEETILHMVRHLEKTTKSRNLYLAGGVALNCVAAGRLMRETNFERIWIPPCASDTGVPFGSALYHYHQTLGHERTFEIRHAFYGLSYSDTEIEQALLEAGLEWQYLETDQLIERVSDDLADGKILGWYQGRFEMGPRALGNRSILADPRRAEMKDKINARIKYREAFRPFAPAVLMDRADEYFEVNQPDPFMTTAPKVRKGMEEQIPAVTHVDGTARIQTVERDANPRYYDLIKRFGEKTGVPVLLNSSFNKQEPIVATPKEAVSCYLRTEMDVLALGNYYVTSRNAKAEEKARLGFAA